MMRLPFPRRSPRDDDRAKGRRLEAPEGDMSKLAKPGTPAPPRPPREDVDRDVGQ